MYFSTKLFVARVTKVRLRPWTGECEENTCLHLLQQNQFLTSSILDEYFRSIGCFKSKSGEKFVADVPNKMSPTGEVSIKAPTGSRKPKNVHKFAAERVLVGITFSSFQ